MGASSILDQIKKLRADAGNLAQEATNLESVLATYPDAKLYTGRWEKKVICSASVNSCVDQYEHRFNCGCCSDSPLEVWPFIETSFGRVYSDPARFVVGDRTYDGHVARAEWYDDFQRHGINKDLLEKLMVFVTGSRSGETAGGATIKADVVTDDEDDK